MLHPELSVTGAKAHCPALVQAVCVHGVQHGELGLAAQLSPAEHPEPSKVPITHILLFQSQCVHFGSGPGVQLEPSLTEHVVHCPELLQHVGGGVLQDATQAVHANPEPVLLLSCNSQNERPVPLGHCFDVPTYKQEDGFPNWQESVPGVGSHAQTLAPFII
jgi:hypothetical protein